MCRFILLYVGLLYTKVVSEANLGSNMLIHYINSCDDNGGRPLACNEGEVIRINDVRCLPYNSSCIGEDRKKLARLCNGLQTCLYVDVRRQLQMYCKEYNGQVITSFQCIPDDSKPICRNNLCGEESGVIRCRRGKVFHLLAAKCFNGEKNCSSDVYQSLYSICEGQRSCQLDHVKRELRYELCRGHGVGYKNIFVDYTCIDEGVISEKCTGTFRTLIPKFGILRSPSFPNNPDGLKLGCYWAIYPNANLGEEVDMIVHLSYSKQGKDGCNSNFLTVQYTSCDQGLQQMERFCEAGRVNALVHSCGTVYVMHQPFPAGHDRGNRYLVSYSVNRHGSKIEAYENHAHGCEMISPNLQSTLETSTNKVNLTTENKSTETKISKQPQNDHSLTSSEVEPTRKKQDDPPSNDPWRLVTILRVVVVNIFLGLLIIALIMALVFVCYRYRTYGRKNKRYAACKSETATTLDEKNSNELKLLPKDDDKSQNLLTLKENHRAACDSERELLQKMTSVSIVSPYETTILHYNRDTQDTNDDTLLYDSETGLSVFFPNLYSQLDTPKYQNSESAYSSLDAGDEDIQRAEQLEVTDSHPKLDGLKDSQFNNQTFFHKKHITDSNDLLPSEPCSTYFNNDVYAVASKSPGHRIDPTKPGRRVQHVHISKGSNPYDVVNISNDSQMVHVHPIPEDHLEYSSPSSMHIIPEHNCLLHTIPPPPAPAKMPADVSLSWS